ncbi:chromatin assembly factor 1 subunit B [Lutzomyia longipalpis]|uniref:chromatin assembly factor 1 subunit B n=1 Tax=Lutzomyia longipalpis TaxID=7200 RepID=UPI002483F049|nr:chromatin assembly factor 1 subunit B [Lutzomyia longipalpis]
MKCTIPEISWHNRDPVLSVDIQPFVGKSGDFYRLASGGTDSHVLIWHMKLEEDGRVSLEIVADLTRHQRAVNAVRWSPSGKFLASGDDESAIFIWKQRDENETINILDTPNDLDKEVWITFKILRGHLEDVYDLAWSPNDLQLISGSVDNTAIVWDVQKGKALTILSDHKGFVQGVSWDPANKYIATLSTDRYFRVFDVHTRKVISRNGKCQLPVPPDSPFHGKVMRLFHDDTLQTFFRRLTFSPDGELIVAPAGIAEGDESRKAQNTTYVYTRHSLKQPAIVLPSLEHHTVAVKFCPVLFELMPHKEDVQPVIPLLYRMVFAVATKNSVFFYDTQQTIPFGVISNIHYTRLTDLTWSSDGRLLVVSSTDGFCSLITFSEGELGKVYDDTLIKEKLMERWEPTKKTSKSKKVKKEGPPDSALTPDVSPKRQTGTSPQKANENLKPISEKIIDLDLADKIIKSDENFSPEKKENPVTPIAVRRHPRVLTPTSADEGAETAVRKPSTPKQPKPIAIRRHPRVLSDSPANTGAVAVTEEAVDAWPIDVDPPKPLEGVCREPTAADSMQECTENINLVLDDDSVTEKPSQEPMEVDKPQEVTPSNAPKTPRRVNFITISTPKSKKKLL